MGSTAWFDRGVEAFQLARPSAPKCYPCPICLHDHFTPSDLTIDHFPPKSQGGKSGVLTCAECNNWAGTELEADMKLAESVYDFASGTMKEPVYGQVIIDGHTLNATILATGSNVSVSGGPGLNDRTAERALSKQIGKRSEEQQWGNFEIKLSFGKHKREDALAGWLRSAYLAIFSAWGFTYILRPQLNAVREHIRDPDSQALRVFGFTMPKPEFDEPRIFLIERPESLAGHFAVIMGRHAVYLPGFGGNDLYGELARQSDAGLEGTVSKAMEVRWPEHPRYDLDFALSKRN